jgi:hypothetical protein
MVHGYKSMSRKLGNLLLKLHHAKSALMFYGKHGMKLIPHQEAATRRSELALKAGGLDR